MIEMSGKLLNFDKVDKTNTMFSKECEITLPDVVPVTWEFNQRNPGDIIGTATITKNVDDVTCDVKLFNFDRDLLRSEFNDEIGIGGYYTQVKSHVENNVRVIDKAILRMVGTTLTPADDDLKMIVIKKGDLENDQT